MLPPVAPTAQPRPVTTEHHGRIRVDDFEWLRDKDNPEVIAFLEANNAYTDERTAHLADLRQTLFEEIKERTLETDLSLPIRRKGYWYYGRTFEGRDYGASCRVPVTDESDWTPPTPDATAGPDRPALPGEEVLLDLDALAEGHEFFSLGGSSVSHATNLISWSVDLVGDERYTIRVKDLSTGVELPDVIEGAMGGASWDRDGTSFFYSTVDEAWRPDKIWRHRLGTAQAEDELIFHEPDERFWTGLGRTRTERFLMIESAAKVTSEIRFLDLDDPDAVWQVFQPRTEGLEYSLEHAVIRDAAGEVNDVFLVHHNHSGPDFEISQAPISPTAPEAWAPFIPHTAGVRLEGVDAFAAHVVVHQRSNGLTQLRILDLGETGVSDDYLVEFDDELYTVGSGGNPDFRQPTIRIGYTTMRKPSQVFDYDIASRALTLRKEQTVLPLAGTAYDVEAFSEHRLWATAPDGEQVPISIVVSKAARGDGNPVPIHLYAYGSYEHSIDPGFSVARLCALDRGVAFAIAHVRGGGEMGRRWYDEGKLAAKVNTFTDFIACAQHLVDTGWTTPGQIVAEGGSAGGLLMGAVANMAPAGLFGGIVAGVPFVDNLTTMLDATLPLTVVEYDEWGNPEADPEVYDLLASYAPYDNVTAKAYPPILAETSLNDTRVLFVEPAKWVARLRHVAQADVLLKTEMAAGHGGVTGRYKSWHERAFSLAWILERLGRTERL